MRAYVLAAVAFGALPCPARCAMLRPFAQITAASVHLADLFEDLGSTPDRVLGQAPAPGARIIVGSPQLAAIARDYNVDWRPRTGGEQSVLERRGDVVAPARVMAALRTALTGAGAPEDFDIAAPDIGPLLVPAGSDGEPAVSQLGYDPSQGQSASHFTAEISVADGGVRLRISGIVVAMATASIATHRLVPGSVLAPGDLRSARVRAGLLHASAAVSMRDAVGMAVRHDVQAGQVLTASDLVHPAMVERGAAVRMVLNADGLALSAQGIAKEAGTRGQRIQIENPLSHRLVFAEVTAPDEVRVDPGPTRLASAP